MKPFHYKTVLFRSLVEGLQQKKTMAEYSIFHLKKYRETVSQEAEAATDKYTVRRTDGCEGAHSDCSQFNHRNKFSAFICKSYFSR